MTKVIEITLAQDGSNDGSAAVTVPFNQGLVVSYIGLAILIAGIFLAIRKGKK